MSKENIEHQQGIDKITAKLKNFSKEVIASSKKSYEFLKAKNLVKSDYDKFLTENELKKIDKKLESKQEDVLECFAKYEKLNDPKPKFLPFLLGYLGYNSLDDKNDYLSVVDFSMDAKSDRLFLINMKTNEVEINTTCMQGQGKNGVQTFSNKNGSYQSSIGLVQISSERSPEDGSRYGGVQPYKENDEKLIVYGKEEGFNDNVHARYIYMHTGDASKGCFTLPQNNIGHDILRKMAFGGVIMSFYPDAEYLKKTNLLS